MMMSIVLLALAAGLLHGYNQQRARAEHAKQFGRMSLLFNTAASRLQALLQDEPGSGEPGSGEPGSGEQGREQARALIVALGREALSENGDWVLLHRERPLEVPRAG